MLVKSLSDPLRTQCRGSVRFHAGVQVINHSREGLIFEVQLVKIRGNT